MLGLWLAPLAWAADLGLSYSLVEHSCSTGHYYVLHVITLVCFCMAMAGFTIAWRQYRWLPHETNDEGGSAYDRSYFLALLGIASSVGFMIAIIATAVPRWILSPCD